MKRFRCPQLAFVTSNISSHSRSIFCSNQHERSPNLSIGHSRSVWATHFRENKARILWLLRIRYRADPAKFCVLPITPACQKVVAQNLRRDTSLPAGHMVSRNCRFAWFQHWKFLLLAWCFVAKVHKREWPVIGRGDDVKMAALNARRFRANVCWV